MNENYVFYHGNTANSVCEQYNNIVPSSSGKEGWWVGGNK